jgi:hypothetical protein
MPAVPAKVLVLERRAILGFLWELYKPKEASMTLREHDNQFDPVAEERAPHEQGWHDVLTLLMHNGFEGFANAMQILMNEAMKLEREAALGAQRYERTAARRGHANGFKPKTVETRVGRLELAVPQTRGVAFYPSALERGTRSERALKLAIAERNG